VFEKYSDTDSSQATFGVLTTPESRLPYRLGTLKILEYALHVHFIVVGCFLGEIVRADYKAAFWSLRFPKPLPKLVSSLQQKKVIEAAQFTN
jgi:hypothetical protein